MNETVTEANKLWGIYHGDRQYVRILGDPLRTVIEAPTKIMTASEDGTSDYNCVDVIREAGATIVAAAQSTTSLIPPLGADKSKVLTLNLRNPLIFRAADEGDAIQAADFIGKKRVVKRSWGFSAGKRTVNYSETEEHKLKPHRLRQPPIGKRISRLIPTSILNVNVWWCSS